MRRGDSRTELRSLFDGPLGPLRHSSLFLYLDADWNEDLPLAEEFKIVYSRCPAAVVMIDDFEVPGDPGYGFDDYGPGKALNAPYIDPAVRAHELAVFYPSTPSAKESGAHRGCVVLCNKAVHGATLASIPLLRCP